MLKYCIDKYCTDKYCIDKYCQYIMTLTAWPYLIALQWLLPCRGC
jgi:hypothetical protein